MPKNIFKNVVQNFKNVIEISQDKRLIPYYAEYLVASELSGLGYNVEVLKKRRGPDLVVHVNERVNKLVQVKSSHMDLEEWACGASFYNGTSIARKEFDICVFVVFEKMEPIEYLVFTLNELEEVAERKRPYPITAFPNNPCVLFWYKRLQEYERVFPNVENRLGIEIKLHMHPEEFRRRWDKIVWSA